MCVCVFVCERVFFLSFFILNRPLVMNETGILCEINIQNIVSDDYTFIIIEINFILILTNMMFSPFVSFHFFLSYLEKNTFFG